MLESLLKVLFRDEEALDEATKQAAQANWMRLFDGRWATLQKLIDLYPVSLFVLFFY